MLEVDLVMPNLDANFGFQGKVCVYVAMSSADNELLMWEPEPSKLIGIKSNHDKNDMKITWRKTSSADIVTLDH